MDDPTRQHLLAWAATRDERAFRAVVERYAGLVHGAALRRTGNPELAAEAAQAVFVKLAQKPREAAAHPAAWLHRAAVFEAQHVLRSEFRHRRRAEALAKSMSTEPESESWSSVRVHLDEALNAMPAADRRVLLLRFFEEHTAAQIGEALGVSTEAAQKRTVRALDRLAGLLRRRGVAVPVAMLASGLTHQLADAAPAGLVSKLTAAATSAAPSAGFLTSSLAAMSTAKLTTAAIVAVSASLPVMWDAAFATSSPRKPASAIIRDPNPAPQAPKTPALPAPEAPADLASFVRELDRFATAENPPAGLERQLRRRIFEMNAEQIRALAAMLPERKNPSALYDIIAAVYGRWMETDPEGAKAAILARQEPYLKHAARHGLLGTWAATDPQGALAWLIAHADMNEHGFGMMNVFRGWAHRDPKAAADGALTVPEESRSGAVHAALSEWAASPREAESAVLWANALTDDGLRHKASSTLVDAMRDWSISDAVQLSMKLEDAEARTEGIEMPLRRNVTAGDESAVAAGKAFHELPAERQDPDVAGRLVASAALYGGLPAARAFIDQLAGGPARDEACERFAAAAAQNNKHAEAAAYATRLPIDSGSTRMDLFTAGWASYDTPAATAWVQSLPEGGERQAAQSGLEFAAKHNLKAK